MSLVVKVALSVALIIAAIVALPIAYIQLLNYFFELNIEVTLMNVGRLYFIGIIIAIMSAGMRTLIKEIMEDER